MKYLLLVIIACCSFFVIPTQTQGEIYLEQHEYSLTLPDAWVEIPKQYLRAFVVDMKNIEMSQGQSISDNGFYDSAYQLKSDNLYFQLPFIVIKINREGRISEEHMAQYDSLRSVFLEGRGERGDPVRIFRTTLGRPMVGEKVYDRNNHILWTATKVDGPDGQGLTVLTITKLTEVGYIQLTAVAKEEAYWQHSIDIKKIAYSINTGEEDRYKVNESEMANGLIKDNGLISFFKLDFKQSPKRGLIFLALIGLIVWISLKLIGWFLK